MGLRRGEWKLRDAACRPSIDGLEICAKKPVLIVCNPEPLGRLRSNAAFIACLSVLGEEEKGQRIARNKAYSHPERNRRPSAHRLLKREVIRAAEEEYL